MYTRSLGLVVANAALVFCRPSRAPAGVLDDAHRYVTRPDIEVPKWEFQKNILDELSPGYWFVSPYDFLDQSRQNGGKWTAPMILDVNGELVWSGSYLSQQYDVFDFRLSNVLGEDMLTMIYPRNRTALVIDNTFKMRHTVPVAPANWHVDMVNMHDFSLSRDGTSAMYFYDENKNMTTAQSSAIGFTDWDCSIRDNCLRQLDVSRGWKQDFEWCLSDHLDFAESQKVQDSLSQRCSGNWDAFHVNSADKFPDGGWLVSSRHSDTLYKIAADGSLAWRLGGTMSDFQADFKFARQHDGRVIEQNETHTIISLFDNAKDEFIKTSSADRSRGLLVAVNDKSVPKTATLLAEYSHPRGARRFTEGRANMQVLPNGNVFICWVNGLLLTEHAPDGRVIMEARVKQEWLKSYRSYKFQFVGRPQVPPDVYAETVVIEDDKCGRSLSTSIFVSWNGATEVRRWDVYKTDVSGQVLDTTPVVSRQRSGFETHLTYAGSATHLVVEAFGDDGTCLGRSKVVSPNLKSSIPGDLLADEIESVHTKNSIGVTANALPDSWSGYAMAFFIGACFAIIVQPVMRRWRSTLSHQRPSSSKASYFDNESRKRMS